MFANMPSALLPAMARAYGRPSFWPCHCQNVSVCPLKPGSHQKPYLALGTFCNSSDRPAEYFNCCNFLGKRRFFLLKSLIFPGKDDIMPVERFWSDLFLRTKICKRKFSMSVQAAERRNCCEGKVIRKTDLRKMQNH